jgi:DNA-binding NarL/FixJ family response regulator
MGLCGSPPVSKRPVKILVVDDHALVREGLHQVLKGLDENVSVLQAGNCAQAFAIADAHPDLDLVLLDYHLPDMTGLQALDIFGKDHPELPIVMLSGSANIQVMRQVLQSGASGFVTKSTLSDELLNAVRQVLDGDVYSPLELEVADYATLPFDAASSKPPLSQRQELVLRELLDGRSNREIGMSLNISEETVKTHVTSILRYFDVQNRTQAVVAAARSGYRASQVN